MSFNPPTQQINTYNPTYWALANPSFLSLQQAYLTFLPLKGGTLTGSLYAPQLFLSGDITSTAGITLTNVASQISLANTSASTSSSTGALIIPSGGIYVGNNSIFNSSINMTASTSLLTLSGINSQINISNNFSASISSSTGALLCSGGAYFGNNSIISGTLSGISTLTATNLSGTLTTAAQTNITSVGNLTSLTMFGDINMSGHNISNINVLTLTGTTDSSSISTGALIVPGGVGIAKSLFVGSLINVSNAVGGNMLTLNCSSSTSRSTLYLQSDSQNWEFGCRGSAIGNDLYIWNGGYKLQMNTSGDTVFNSTTNSTSSTTGSLVLSGGLGVANNVYCNGTLNLNYNGSNINIVNGSNSGLIELAASPNILRAVNGYALNIGTAGINIGNASTRNPVCPLDMGQTASNMIISLYNNTTSYYGLSANNSATQISSATDVTMYTGCTNSSPINSIIATFSSYGNIISQSGIHANSYSTTGLASYGNSAHMHYAGGVASFFGYNYNTGAYIPASFNNVLYCSSGGELGIGTTSPTFPLDIQTSISGSFSGSYGYLDQSGSGTLSNTGTVGVSLRCTSRIFCTEIDCQSDKKIKENIRDITEEEAIKFINEVIPINYNMIKTKEKSYGYIAQNVLKIKSNDGTNHLFEDLIELHPYEDGIDEDIDEDGFISPKDYIFTINYMKVIPILHKALQLANDKILNNNKMIHQLQTQINNLQNKPDTPGFDTLNFVTESNHKQQAINNNFDQRIALTEQNRIIYESRIADLEKKMNLLGINSIW